MKKGIKIFLIILISLLVLAGGIFGISSAITLSACKNIEKSSITMMPSVDIVQPWMFEGYDDEDYDNYLQSLKNDFHYDTIIVQMTRSENYGGHTAEGSTYYYNTEIADEEFNNDDKVIILDYLPDIMDACVRNDMGVFIGLSVEEESWWTLTCYYDEDYMTRVGDIDIFMFDELYEMYGEDEKYQDVLKGWYFAYELYSNPLGWENLWGALTNRVISHIHDVDENRPVLLSPFRQYQFGPVTNEYLMWKNFFSQVEFKEGDIFCPQDSMGKLNRNGKSEKLSYRYIYEYLNQINRAIEEDGRLEYWVNVEIYQAPPVIMEDELVLADFNRVKNQLKNANRVADKLVTFSASHYMYDLRKNDTKEIQDAFVNNYKALLNDLNK